MKINCDLGESFGAWTMGLDEMVMAHIDQANIACGFHAGDPLTMLNTILLAKQHQVTIGAHPSYPDLVGFGRRSLACSTNEIIAFMLYQLAAIDGVALSQGVTIAYVKPHGALYNDMMRDSSVFEAILAAISQYNRPRENKLKLMILATPEFEQHCAIAQTFDVALLAEAFADRQYTDEGLLVPRELAGAVHERGAMLSQVSQLVNDNSVTTRSGKTMPLRADSLCVHGDNRESVQAITALRTLLYPCLS